ncbi:unnamed protein product [Dimorphilus gyrociliatus]|uniref:Uncharacterized protein n=1 Tax=Dimorphilus gyrociliatus TaxID=2664684 RepID=A0A7I8W4J7_9ANNE|nr:unnamed protein product [Dimorphilus gyrociliatus]
MTKPPSDNDIVWFINGGGDDSVIVFADQRSNDIDKLCTDQVSTDSFIGSYFEKIRKAPKRLFCTKSDLESISLRHPPKNINEIYNTEIGFLSYAESIEERKGYPKNLKVNKGQQKMELDRPPRPTSPKKSRLSDRPITGESVCFEEKRRLSKKANKLEQDKFFGSFQKAVNKISKYVPLNIGVVTRSMIRCFQGESPIFKRYDEMNDSIVISNRRKRVNKRKKLKISLKKNNCI